MESASTEITHQFRTSYAMLQTESAELNRDVLGPLFFKALGSILLGGLLMTQLSVVDLIPVLQVAIGPAVLVSGVGLLLLTMTNRLGRAIDRARTLVHERSTLTPDNQERVTAQLCILSHRAQLIRRAIILASFSALCAASLTIALFLTALFKLDEAWVIGALFVGCMVCLIASLIVFIQDINQSLGALKLELTATNATEPRSLRERGSGYASVSPRAESEVFERPQESAHEI